MPSENQDVITSETPQENVGDVSNSNNDAQLEFQRNMDLAFANQMSPDELQQKFGQPQEEGKPAEEENKQPDVPPVFNEAEFLKKFGVETEDALKAQLEELNRLRANPTQQTAAEIAFANEESKRLYQYLKEGKTKEVKAYLEGQELASTFETMNDEQKIKTHIKMQFPKFTQQMVDYEFNKRYKVKDEVDYDDPMEYEMDKLRVEQMMETDAQKAVESVSQYRQKIELPELQNNQPTVDEAYEAYKASMAQADETHQKVVVPSIQALKESDLGLSFKINDAQNQMNFDVSVAVDKADLEAAKADALNYAEYMQKTYYDAQGNFNAKRFMQAILRDKKFDSYIQTAARQGAMAERKRVIEKDIPPTTQRTTFASGEKTELEKMLDMVYQGH
jgi:hypothetical protein